MHIAIFHDAIGAGAWTWESFLSAQHPVSGTDSSMLLLCHGLGAAGVEIDLFLNQPPPDHPAGVSAIAVENLLGAIGRLDENTTDCFIFMNRKIDETRSAIRDLQAKGVPTIVWDQNGPTQEIADVLMASCVKRLVCVSASQVDWIRDHPVVYKTTFIYNSLHPFWLRSPQDRPKSENSVCFLGAMVFAKGFHILAKAWNDVIAKVPTATLSVIGSSALYLRNSARGPLGVADVEYEREFLIPHLGSSREELQTKNINFMGLLPPGEIAKVLADASITVVNPTQTGSVETFCVSAVEAQASQCAVLGANRGGLRETVLNGRTGCLVNSERELAPSLVRLLKDPERTTSLGRNGRKWVVGKFHVQEAVGQWLRLLEAVMDESPNRLVEFSWERSTPHTVAREIIRHSRKIPLVGPRLPTAKRIMNVLR